MRHCVALTMAGFVAILANLEAPRAFAQAPPAAAPAPDPVIEAARKAFEALPEGERRAMQDALIWTGDYKGTVDGGFGNMTRAAITAYAKRSNLPTDGTLDAKGRAQLAAAGAKARDAVGFKPVSEPRSGATIGLPTKLLTRRTDAPTGARYATADGSATVDLFRSAEAEGDLPALYDKAITVAPGRRVTYKILRLDFFVVTGDVNGRTFYTRVARGSANNVAVVRGYTLSYAAPAKAGFDTYGIAIANAFAPFATVPTSGTPTVAGAPTGPIAPAAPLAPRPVLVGTAVVVAPGRVVAVLPARACSDAQVAGRKASVIASQPQGGLALLDVPGLSAPALTFTAGAPAAGDILALQQTPRAASPAPSPPGAAATAPSELLVAPGQLVAPVSDKDSPRLSAPVQAGSNGAAIFNRSGGLIGLVGLQKDAPRLVAGIVPQATAPFVGADAAIAYLQGAGVTIRAAEAATGSRTIVEIALRVRASVLPVVCTQ
jgi:peptidoglycan hydrolase-like protein with peptidoglycan-binding domain